MTRPVPFHAVTAAAWGAVASLAVLHWRGLPLSEAATLCPVSLLTGHRCPGCGMGHSVVSAMRGDFAVSFAYHPLGLPLLALWTAWLAWGAFNLYRGREFSEGFPPIVRRPAVAWAAVAVALIVHAVRVV